MTSAAPAYDGGPEVLVPYWLSADHRRALADTVREVLTGAVVHPLVGLHLDDVLTELHVAAARDALWPTSAARVRRATGWSEDVLPVRLSAAELAALLDLAQLPAALRALFDERATR